MKIVTNNLEIDVLEGIQIIGSNTRKYIDVGEEEYVIFKELNQIKIFPYDKIKIINYFSIDDSKTNEIEVKIALKFHYEENIIEEQYKTIFKKRNDRGVGFFYD